MLLWPILLSCALSLTVHPDVSAIPSTAQAVVQEFDLHVRDWRKGAEIRLHHPLFALTHASAGAQPNVILFQGESFGQPGEISLQFYTLDGDLVHVPKNQLTFARVDRQHRKFVVSAVIPRLLRERTGVVQVTFSGAKRAAFLLKVEL
jgi:hypothetical protein